jgi:ankyrin repeat protein
MNTSSLIKRHSGQTPLDLATANNHKDIADLLKLKREQDKNALY